MRDFPLRLSSDRVWLYGATLTAIGLAAALTSSGWQGDWENFWSGGATAGTADLINLQRHYAWETAHHLNLEPFVYPPGVAWFFVPAAHLSVAAGFTLNSIVMLILCGLSGLLSARIYGLKTSHALLAVSAWVPAVQAGFLGQFTPLDLFLSLVAILGLSRGNQYVSGIAIGLMLYKPMDAIPFLLLLVVRREAIAFVAAATMALLWYAASALAAAGDWLWPVQYFSMLHDYREALTLPGLESPSLPGVLIWFRVQPTIAIVCGAILVLAAIPAFLRRPMLECASFAPLVGVAASPHAYMYEAALALPSLLYTMTHAAEPWRTRIIVAAYVIAPTWVLAIQLRFSPTAVIVVGGTLIWLATAYRALSHASRTRQQPALP
jgi:hypothetical protein